MDTRELIERLRAAAVEIRNDGTSSQVGLTEDECMSTADALSFQAIEIERLTEALEWYGEQARLCRLIHSGGDAGRHALADDGGKRARAALTPKPNKEGE